MKFLSEILQKVRCHCLRGETSFLSKGAVRNSITARLNCSGHSSYGKCPTPGKTTARQLGKCCANRFNDDEYTAGSLLPHISRVGIARSFGNSVSSSCRSAVKVRTILNPCSN